VPIPGTTKLHRLRENTAAANLKLSGADLADINSAADKIDLTADRYPEAMQRWINR
jgi:aryl-alcohol dehydrogenase-like predicted oxidoreductase